MTTALEGKEHHLLEFCVKPQNPYVGKDYLDFYIDLKVEHDCVLVGINKNTEP